MQTVVEASTGLFDCNICLESARNPVITVCGHLYCWPCLYKWLKLREHEPSCPVCKSAVSRDCVIPIYGRGSPEYDPRSVEVPSDPIPDRPKGRISFTGAEAAQAEEWGAQPFHHFRRRRPAAAADGAAAAVPAAEVLAQHAAFAAPAIARNSSFGFFPSMFGLQLVPPAAEEEDPDLSAEQAQQVFLSRLLLVLGCFVILCLLLF